MRTYDVLIIGSGFAGSLLGLALVSRGQSVLIVDRQRHPRFAIGESSTPAADYVLESLCEQYEWNAIQPLCRYGSWCRERPHVGRGLKRGFSYFHQRPDEHFSPGESHARELMVTASARDEVADTHWFRADVDRFLAEQYQTAGGTLWEQAALKSLVRSSEPTPMWKVQIQRSEGTETLHARFIVDGSGADSLLKDAFGIYPRGDQCRTRSRAIFGHFTGVTPWEESLHRFGISTAEHPFRCDDAALHHLMEGGWMWQLRFDHSVTSVGFALDETRWPLDLSVSPAEEWRQLLARYPSIAEQLQDAQPVAPLTSDLPLIRTPRMQRRVDRTQGPGWALLPHAAGFIDPFYSTGIAHSLLGVEELADILTAADSSPSEARWAGYEARLQREIDLIDRLVSLAYGTFGRDPRLLHAASMLYFAAATTWETRRRSGVREAFLLADDRAFSQVVDEAIQTFPQTDQAIAAWCSNVETAIAPWNSVGLFQPEVPNMYRHSAAEKGLVSSFIS